MFAWFTEQTCRLLNILQTYQITWGSDLKFIYVNRDVIYNKINCIYIINNERHIQVPR